MTRTLDTDQSAIVKSATLSATTLVKLTCYSDKAAGTVSSTGVHYISKNVVLYKYDSAASAIPFKPWLQSISPLRAGMVNVPGGQGSGVTVNSITVTLENSVTAQLAGSRVSATLLADNLEGATIEISELLNRSRFGGDDDNPRGAHDDYSSMTGNEHTVWFRGRVRRRVVSHESITLLCETEIPTYQWPQILSNDQLKRDVGSRFPIPYGTNAIVRCPSFTAGWVSTLTTAMGDAASTADLSVTDTTFAPASPTTFDVLIGDEIVNVDVLTATTLDVNGRAQDTTTGSPHPYGTPVIEVASEYKFIVSAFPISGVNSVMIRNPLDDRLVEVKSGYAVDLADTAVITGSSIPTVTFTSGNMLDLYQSLAPQQASTTATTESSSSATPTASSTIGANARDGVDGTSWLKEGTGSTASDLVVFSANANMVSQTLRIRIDANGTERGFNYVKLRRDSTSGPVLLRIDQGDGSGPTDFTVNYVGTDNEFYLTWSFWNWPSFPETYGGDILLYEVSRTENEINVPASVATAMEVQAARLGMDMELYADVDGVTVPTEYVTTAYGFNDSDTWNTSTDDSTSRVTSSPTPDEGSACREIIPKLWLATSETSIDACDLTTGWTFGGGTGSLEGTIKKEGSNSIKNTRSGAGFYFEKLDFGGLTLDMLASTTEVLMVFWLRIDHTDLTTESVQVRIGDEDMVTGWYEWDFPASDFPTGTWRMVVIDGQATPDTTSGSDPRSIIDAIRVTIPWNSADVTAYLDNIITIDVGAAGPSRLFNQIIVQDNSLVNEDITGGEYKVALRHDATDNPIPKTNWIFEIHAAAETETGTTAPAAYRKIEFDTITGTDDAWVDVTSSSVIDVGSNDITLTDTLRIVANYPLAAHGVWEDVTVGPSLYIDNLRGSTAVAGYSAAAGAELAAPTDVAKHWVEVVGGETMNATTLATALTNLGSNTLCGDARGWGTDFISVLDHIAYISRCNIFPSEQSTGLEWKAVCAESDYGWPAADKTITLFEPENISDVGRDQGNELFAGRTFLYAYQPYLTGGGTDGYGQLIRIGPDQNDASTKVAAGIISAATAAFGDIEADPQQLLGICDTTSAIEVAGYYYTELARLASIYLIDQLEWSDAYSLEIGDVIEFTLPWASTVTIKARIIEYEKNFDTMLASIRAAGVA